MYIAVVILVLIIAIELYPIIIKIKENKENIIESQIESEIENQDETIFLSYKEYDSFEKHFKAGKIYTKGNHNLFIIKKEEVLIMYPGKVYDLKDDFKLRYLKVKNSEVLEYYYA